jgi:hypothetical protein
MVSDQNKSVPLEPAWSKMFYREITVLVLEQQRKSLFCIGSTVLYPFFSFFSPGVANDLNIIERCVIAHSKEN